MAKSSDPSGPGDSSGQAKAAIAKLIAGIKAGCLEAGPREECLRFVKAAKRAAKNGDADAVIDQTDLFVLCLQRHLCTQISLQHAADLFEIAVTGIKPAFGQPAQILAEARPFAERLAVLAARAGTPLVPRRRPVPPAAGIRATRAAIESAIRSYALPADAEAALLEPVSRMARLAVLEPPAATEEDVAAFRAAASEFYGLLAGLEGNDITSTQSHHLAGLVIFSRTGAICHGLIPIIIQIILVGAVVIIIFRGIKGTFSKPAAAGKARSINQFIVDSGTAPESIAAEVDRVTEGASRARIWSRSAISSTRCCARAGSRAATSSARRRRPSTLSTPRSTSDSRVALAFGPQASAYTRHLR
jgi:hypothetical protein